MRTKRLRALRHLKAAERHLKAAYDILADWHVRGRTQAALAAVSTLASAKLDVKLQYADAVYDALEAVEKTPRKS